MCQRTTSKNVRNHAYTDKQSAFRAIRKVSRALGHSSVTITERYYAKWNKALQDILDGDLCASLEEIGWSF